MDELKLELADKERLLKKEQNILDTFYPDGDEGLSDNNKRTYKKVSDRIKELEKDINKLKSKIK